MDTDCEELLRGSFVLDVRVSDENRDGAKMGVDVDDATLCNDAYDFTTTISKLTITPLSIAGVGNSFCFDEIVVISEIDDILIGEDHKIDVN